SKVVDSRDSDIEGGGEEHRMADAEQACVAEQQIVAHGEHGQHHDAGHDAVVVGRQDELQREKQRQDAEMKDEGAGLRLHRVACPNRPCGRNTSTSATASVAMILARVGEKKTETMPSDRPMSSAATTVPRNEPRPPMMTTMKESSSGSPPIR